MAPTVEDNLDGNKNDYPHQKTDTEPRVAQVENGNGADCKKCRRQEIVGNTVQDLLKRARIAINAPGERSRKVGGKESMTMTNEISEGLVLKVGHDVGIEPAHSPMLYLDRDPVKHSSTGVQDKNQEERTRNALRSRIGRKR